MFLQLLTIKINGKLFQSKLKHFSDKMPVCLPWLSYSSQPMKMSMDEGAQYELCMEC